MNGTIGAWLTSFLYPYKGRQVCTVRANCPLSEVDAVAEGGPGGG